MILLMIVRLGAVWAKHVKEWLNARELQKGFQRHKSDSTTGLTNNSRTDSVNNCRPRTKSTDRTDRELRILNDISDSTDDSTDFTDPTVESTGCTDCTKPTDV